jgi:hypothetical protein
MASEVSICNIALLAVGHDTITTLTEGSKGARACNLRYAETRDSMLRAHPWNFAVRRVDLALLGSTPEFEYTYQHALPADCLKIIRTEAESLGYTDDYRLEGLADGSRILLCNDSAVAIEYIAQVTDPNQMDVLFRDALTSRLAAEICPFLTDNASLSKNLWEIAENKLRLAMTMDAQEGTPRDPNPDTWLVARL